MSSRGLVETSLQHELVHVVVDTLAGGKAPRWLAEKIALYVASEGKLIHQNAEGCENLRRDEMAYAAAYQAVRNLVGLEG